MKPAVSGILKSTVARPVKLAQPSTSTGGGQAVIEKFSQPTAVIGGGLVVENGFTAPPNTANAVLNQTASSKNVMENTVTTAGTGAGRTSLPVTVVKKSQNYYVAIGALAVLLVAAMAWDRGKL